MTEVGFNSKICCWSATPKCLLRKKQSILIYHYKHYKHYKH